MAVQIRTDTLLHFTFFNPSHSTDSYVYIRCQNRFPHSPVVDIDAVHRHRHES